MFSTSCQILLLLLAHWQECFRRPSRLFFFYLKTCRNRCGRINFFICTLKYFFAVLSGFLSATFTFVRNVWDVACRSIQRTSLLLEHTGSNVLIAIFLLLLTYTLAGMFSDFLANFYLLLTHWQECFRHLGRFPSPAYTLAGMFSTSWEISISDLHTDRNVFVILEDFHVLFTHW